MDRFSSDEYLTTSGAARLLDVHASTVKRWCNDGELEYATTDGGHRRIHLTAALDAARDREIPTFLTQFTPYERHVWGALREAADQDRFTRARNLSFGWLARGQVERFRELFYELGRHPELEAVRFVDGFVRGFMEDVGTAWSQGRIRVGDEHLASQAVLEVLLRLRKDWLEPRRGSPSRDGPGPVAVVGAIEGESHHLGAMCVRLLLERDGWRVVYLGPSVPIEDFSVVQRAHGAELVAISLAPPHTGADVRRAIRILTEFYRSDDRYRLAFGGGGCRGFELDQSMGQEWPFPDIRSFASARAFVDWVRESWPNRGGVG